MTKATEASAPNIFWRLFMGFMSASKSIILPLALVAALAFNVATLTSMTIFNLLSSAVGAAAALVTSKPVTVNRKLKSEHKAKMTKLSNDLDAQKKRLAKFGEALKTEKSLTAKQRVQIDAAERHMASLDNYNNDLRRRLDAKAHVRFKGKKRTIGQAVEETTERISRRVAQATARSTGSIFAESIPYIGIGAIVAVTTWEVADACETMEDLHELDLAFNPDSASDSEHSEVCGQQVPTEQEIIETVKRSPARAWEQAKELAPTRSDLPSWDDTRRSAQAAWHRVSNYIESLLGL